MTDGVSVSITSSQNKLLPNAASAEPQNPMPFERAALNARLPRYGCPNWLVVNASSSHAQPPERLCQIEPGELSGAEGLASVQDAEQHVGKRGGHD